MKARLRTWRTRRHIPSITHHHDSGHSTSTLVGAPPPANMVITGPMASLSPIGVLHEPGTEPVYALPAPPRGTEPDIEGSDATTVEIREISDADTVELRRLTDEVTAELPIVVATETESDDAQATETEAADAESPETESSGTESPDTDSDEAGEKAEVETDETSVVEDTPDADADADASDEDEEVADEAAEDSDQPDSDEPDSGEPDSDEPADDTSPKDSTETASDDTVEIPIEATQDAPDDDGAGNTDAGDADTASAAATVKAIPNMRDRRTSRTSAEPDTGTDTDENSSASTVRIPKPVWTLSTKLLSPTAPATAETATDRESAVAPAGAATLAPGRIRRSRALDGVRGIAVLAVVLYHFFGDAVRGGYLGVDIFFVLSGFLITSLLVREYGAKKRISLSQFWTRRARRILPAALTVLVVATAVAGLIGGDVGVQLKSQFLGSAFFVNNWVQIAQSHSYFAETTPQIFMHYWSLAIEEQFYVVWPLLFLGVLWLARRTSTRTQLRITAAVTIALGAASVAAMIAIYNPDTDPSRVYFGSDTHSFGLLIGAALALLCTAPAADAADSWPRRVSPRTAEILGKTLAPAVFVGLLVLMFTLPDTSPLTYQGGLLLASVLTAGVIHTAVGETGPVPVILRVKALRYLGERSFSLYLWHWPVVVFLRAWFREGTGTASFSLPGWLIGILAAVITLGLSELSYRYIETPFRRKGFRGVLRDLGNSARLPIPAAVFAAGLVMILFAGSALGTSPSKSQLELQLDHLAELQRQSNASPPPAPPRPAAPSAPRLPTGQEITGIGDSVMLASSQALRARFPGIYIDAQVSRHYSGGEGVIEDLRASGALRKYVVLGFGTNGQAFPGQLDRILSEIGPGHLIVLLVPFGPVDGIPQAAQQVLQYAPRHRNVFLAPWCQTAAAHPENLGPDDVHPMGPGTWMYADAVTAGLQQAVTGKRDPNITCPI
ncbi:acyltransferase family protein [Gordonia polyisoprenivorans]|uniref:acyltransferase family protein n=1 Tax=Gordonia polyisoprenivorans TaxID=84595 RepID=UPI001AD69B8A|nr:acyltransferase family protein [Gordonia polyisoprenivorans]QTI67663.1 acyltransferase family protein [Gordonia polyisoprenivorans]